MLPGRCAVGRARRERLSMDPIATLHVTAYDPCIHVRDRHQASDLPLRSTYLSTTEDDDNRPIFTHRAVGAVRKYAPESVSHISSQPSLALQRWASH